MTIEAVQRLAITPNERSVTPTLFITWEAWRQLLRYVRHAAATVLPDGKKYPVEINGWAYVQQLDNLNFLLQAPEDVVIIKQTVSPAKADIDATDNALLFARARQAGRQNELKLQWHSHVHGQAYFSSTDDANIESLGRQGASWMLSLVTNVRGEVEARFDQFRPFRIGAPIDVHIGALEDMDAEYAVYQQIEQLVTVVPPPKPQPKQQPSKVVQKLKRGSKRGQSAPNAADSAEQDIDAELADLALIDVDAND